MPERATGRVVEPRPGMAHPATRGQHWQARHLRGLLVAAALWPVVGILVPLVSGPMTSRAWLFALCFSVAGAAPLLLLAWYVDPNVRQRRYLRRYPWVEYDAQVSGFTTRTLRCVVTFTDDAGTLRSYKVDPNDDDYERGQRPIWFAGVPGGAAAVISLRQGACTGMAYPSPFVPGRSAAASR